MMPHFDLNLSLVHWNPKSAMILVGRPYSVRMLVKWLLTVWLVMSFRSLITGYREW